MRYFTADTHFGHTNILNKMLPRCYPGTNVLFRSIEDHDECLLYAINAVVGERDELYVLGDFARKPGKYRARIKCKHVRLIRGNHDPVQKSKNVFGEIPYIIHTKVRSGRDSLRVVLCHTPMAYWDGSHRGWGHLYGHCHGQREATMTKLFGVNRRSMDVGVDCLKNYIPLSEEHLCHFFTSLSGHDPVGFYRDLQARGQ
jgi:calcineurin-like phosphoesterase family protein